MPYRTAHKGRRLKCTKMISLDLFSCLYLLLIVMEKADSPGCWWRRTLQPGLMSHPGTRDPSCACCCGLGTPAERWSAEKHSSAPPPRAGHCGAVERLGLESKSRVQCCLMRYLTPWALSFSEPQLPYLREAATCCPAHRTTVRLEQAHIRARAHHGA